MTRDFHPPRSFSSSVDVPACRCHDAIPSPISLAPDNPSQGRTALAPPSEQGRPQSSGSPHPLLASVPAPLRRQAAESSKTPQSTADPELSRRLVLDPEDILDRRPVKHFPLPEGVV